ncbi:MAG: M28 family peptidase [Bacillota bacterium]|nr:M28 family peptidase [Bacillota bacterium]
MIKKIIACAMSVAFAFGLTACGGSDYGESYDNYAANIDTAYVKEVAETLGSFGDDEVMGMRSAGSPAEKQACDYLQQEMKNIGLQNIEVEEATVDGWTFKGANITFTNAKGEEQKIDLGGYQTTLQADNGECELVYVDRGTADNYKDLDVTDKLVLFDINQEEDWWINYPAYQAKVKGAKAAIAMREFVEEADDRVGVQDVCGPADAPALAISNKDSKALQKAIEASGGDSIKVTLNCDSQVTENVKTHNLHGEIPGKTDETIFVFSHMDGYFHSDYDDAFGCGVSLAMAKAILESGYTPDKTIRFCMHGSEEWGREGSEYDWSTGAYEEIMSTHPEWVKEGFAIVNNDGGYAVEGEEYSGIMTSVELKKFVKDSVEQLNEEQNYSWSYDNLSTYTEDFQWTRVGIPAISAGSGEGTKYDDIGYHSTYDSFDAQPLDENGTAEVLQTYGKLVLDLDACNVRPMNFTARIRNYEKSLNDKQKEAIQPKLDEAYAAADALQAKMTEIEEADDPDAAIDMNQKTQEVYLALQDSLLGLDFINVDAIVRHDMYEDNIDYLDQTIDALQKGSIQEAYDEYLWAVDWSWYDMYFDEETCDYMKNQLFEKRDDTWGAGLIKYPHADTGDVVRSLKAKYDEEGADVSEEIAALKEIKAEQEEYLQKTYDSELKGIVKATKLMNQYAK